MDHHTESCMFELWSDHVAVEHDCDGFYMLHSFKFQRGEREKGWTHMPGCWWVKVSQMLGRLPPSVAPPSYCMYVMNITSKSLEFVPDAQQETNFETSQELKLIVLKNCKEHSSPDMPTRPSRRWTLRGSFSGWSADGCLHRRRRKRRLAGGTGAEDDQASQLLLSQLPWRGGRA